MPAIPVHPELERQVRQWRADLDTAMKLEELPLSEEHNRDVAAADFARVFRDYGIAVETLPPAEAAARVAASRIKPDLVLALLTWAEPFIAMPEHKQAPPLA